MGSTIRRLTEKIIGALYSVPTIHSNLDTAISNSPAKREDYGNGVIACVGGSFPAVALYGLIVLMTVFLSMCSLTVLGHSLTLNRRRIPSFIFDGSMA